MAAIFSTIFSCCLRRRRRRQEPVIPDEESRLIPAEATEPTPVIPNVVVIDHQKLKDRLGTIVRSKEGKMVNVNAQIPFNLHNQAIMDPSSSRSASISTNHRYEFPQNSQRYPGLSAAPVPSNLASSSRGPSISRSSSTASVHYDSSRRGSLAPSETNDIRNGILNVRLVNKGYGSVVVGNTPNRLGRPRVRGGGDGRVVSAEIHHIPNGQVTVQQKGKENDAETDSQPQADTKEEVDLPSSNHSSNQEQTPAPAFQIPGQGLVLNLDLSKPRSPLPEPEFKIQVADISLSWDD